MKSYNYITSQYNYLSSNLSLLSLLHSKHPYVCLYAENPFDWGMKRNSNLFFSWLCIPSEIWQINSMTRFFHYKGIKDIRRMDSNATEMNSWSKKTKEFQIRTKAILQVIEKILSNGITHEIKTMKKKVFFFSSLPVMAAVAVRQKVVSIGHFSPCFYFQSLKFFFFLLDQIKSNCMYWLHWKSEENGTEPNELDELEYSK